MTNTISTIGYEGASLEDFISTLRRNGRAREHALFMMGIDYDADGKDLLFYRQLNLSLADRGDCKIARAEFWALSGRRFDPTRLSIYRALLGDLALPAASPG